jgi:hypothetical protein
MDAVGWVGAVAFAGSTAAPVWGLIKLLKSCKINDWPLDGVANPEKALGEREVPEEAVI